MEINVEIKATELAAAVNNLAEALKHMGDEVSIAAVSTTIAENVANVEPKADIPDSEKKVTTRKTGRKNKQVKAEVEEKPVADEDTDEETEEPETVAEDTDEDVLGDAEPKLTRDEVKNRIKAIIEADKSKSHKVKEIVLSYGVKSLTAVPEDKFDELLDKVEKL